MSHPLLHDPRVAPARAGAIARAARARISAATAAAGALAIGATLLLTPRTAHASEDELYQMCLDAVYAYAERCLRSSDNLIGDLGCMWLGGVGYITCAVLEALRQLLPGGINVS